MSKTQAVPIVVRDLYARPEKIYPRQVHGIFARLRIFSVIALLGVYYFTPWLTWDSHQAILLDLPARKFHLFGATFWNIILIFLIFQNVTWLTIQYLTNGIQC